MIISYAITVCNEWKQINYPIKEVKINENPNKDYIVDYLRDKNILLK